MRTLVVLRGAPGSGKSTWIEKWGLKPYTLCADTIRELFESPVMDDERGIMQVSQKNDPYEVLLEKLNSTRYEAVEKALA